MSTSAAEFEASAIAALGARSAEGAINGVTLRWVTAGTGPLVLLLHGFPDSWLVGRVQIAALAAAGYRVVAPDLRGYGDSDAPTGIERYAMDVLADDVVALIAGLGATRATVVGHDWGGSIAWHLALRTPGVVERLVILNAPHPVLFARALRTWVQARRSLYVLFFQLPWLPEALLRAGDFALLERTVRGASANGAALDADMAAMRRNFGRPGALTAALNYYRAALAYPVRALRAGAAGPMPPTMVLWGMRDPFLLHALVDGLPAVVPGVEIVRVPEAGHWVQRDLPEVVNAALLRFLAVR